LKVTKLSLTLAGSKVMTSLAMDFPFYAESSSNKAGMEALNNVNYTKNRDMHKTIINIKKN